MYVKSPLIAYSHKYFQIVENCLGEMIAQGNKKNLKRDYVEDETEQESDLRYREAIKWSDSQIIEPILFSLYHAIELLLKGILILNNDSIEKKHNLENLFFLTEKHLKKSKLLRDLLIKYCTIHQTNHLILNDFFKINKLTPSKYYIILKYPFDNGKYFQYHPIHYTGNKGVELANEILNDIKLMKAEFKNI